MYVNVGPWFGLKILSAMWCKSFGDNELWDIFFLTRVSKVLAIQ